MRLIRTSILAVASCLTSLPLMAQDPPAACAEGTERIGSSTTCLETVIVEPEGDDFADFAEWRKNLEAALAQAKLKERSDLTAHDMKQILILKEDMPRLQAAIVEMAKVIDKNPRRSMLSENEKLKLTRAYLRAQAVLQNVPDELMMKCRLQPRPEQRNESVVCGFDYARAVEFMSQMSGEDSRELERKRQDPRRAFGSRVGVHGSQKALTAMSAPRGGAPGAGFSVARRGGAGAGSRK